MINMNKYILAIGLLAFSVMAQSPSPPPPPRGRPEGPGRDRPSGDGDRRPEMPMPMPMPGEEDKDEPCPPRTGREWICKIDYWDNNRGEVVKSMDRQKCDERDLCYLGPIVSRPLNQPWIRKWMCGPKPCEWEGYIRNEYKRGNSECSGTCSLGPFEIMLNGTHQLNAYFCNMSKENKEDMEDMEEMMESMWASPVCSVNSSVDGEVTIKDCKGGEMCGRGPVNFFHEGTQYRIYMCTKTPEPFMMKKYDSKTEEYFSKIHNKLMDVADALVMNGYVLNEGPFDTIHKLGKKLMELKSHIAFAEVQAKAMGKDKFEIPKYIYENFDSVYVTAIILHNKVVHALGGNKGGMVMEAFRESVDEMFDTFKEKVTYEDMFDLVHENLQWLLKLIRSGDLKSDMAKAAFRSTKELMLKTYEWTKLKDEDNENEKILKIMKDMGGNMQYIWHFMTGGPVRSGVTLETLSKKLQDNFQKIRQELMGKLSPKDMIGSVWMTLEKLMKFAKEGNLMSEEASKVYNNLAVNKFAPLRRFADDLPNAGVLSPMLDAIADNMNMLWNQMTGGITSSASQPAMVIDKIREGVGKLLSYMEEGERMRDRGQRPQPGSGMMDDPPRPQGGDRDILDQVRDSLDDIGRSLRDGERDREMSPREKIMYTIVDSIRQLHEHFSNIRRIPTGPERVILMLSENLGKLVEDMRDKDDDLGGRLGDAISRVRDGAMGLSDNLRDLSSRDRMDFFEEMINGMETIINNAIDKAREMDMDNSLLQRMLQTLRNMRNGGGSPVQPLPRGGDDDMRRRLDDMQKTISDLTMRMMDNMKGDDKGDGGDMRGIGDMGGMMGDMTGGMGDGMMGDDMMGDNMEEECPKPFWKKQIPEEDKMKWHHPEDSFFGPMRRMEEDDDYRKK